MRTTLDLDENLLAAARAIARDDGVSLGVSVSRLALRGLHTSSAVARTDGFPVFAARPGARPITVDMVNEFRD